jgi:hypothetical protein
MRGRSVFYSSFILYDSVLFCSVLFRFILSSFVLYYHAKRGEGGSWLMMGFMLELR